MINRRQFLKTAGIAGLSLAWPSIYFNKEVKAAMLDSVNYSAPSVVPQIINIFLYGGPSELAGNLTNIEDIMANSQNSYPSSLDPNAASSDVTSNYFWGRAGGNVLEDLLLRDQISIYRTLNRIKDDSKAHGRSVTQNLVGNLDLLNPGIASTLAAILATFNPLNKDINELVLPFVSFEGESMVFNLGNLDIQQVLRPMTLDSNFNNPYSRIKNWQLDASDEDTNDLRLESLARQISARNTQHTKINAAFDKREELADFIDTSFNSEQVNNDLPVDPITLLPIAYPDTNFGRRLRAAVSLAYHNPDTVFISLGSGGLGGWDDHSGALEDYPGRMQGLMDALNVAARHMELLNANNIIINVYGDFGRNVNLNDSQGWDHGNNQNYLTLGGSAIPGRSLGKLVGRTKRIGTPFVNRQFTSPADDSYQCEPFAIASSIFKYFGVQNPEVLTGEPAIDESTAVANERV